MSDFKFIVSRKVLLDAVETVGQVVLANPTIPILENVLFGLDAGQLTLRASDLKTTVIQTLAVDAGPEQAGAIALPYKLLRDLLKALPEQAITIAVGGERFTADVLTDNGAYHISGENAIDFPTLPKITNSLALHVNGSVLIEAIATVACCCASDELLKPAMAGVCWTFMPTHLEFVATDAHCLSRLRVPYAEGEAAPTWDDGSPIKIIVPQKPLNLIYALLPVNEPVQVELSHSQLRIVTETTTVYARLTDERYPDYENAIPNNNPIALKIGRKDQQQTLSRVLLLSNRTSGLVALNVNGQLTVEAEDLDYNHTARESLPCDHDGNDIHIGFDGRLMVKLLKIMSSPHVKVNMSRADRPAILTPVETPTGGRDLLLLHMPLLLNPFDE